MIPLRTNRLTIRELELTDARFILELVNTPGWLQYIGDRNIHSIKDAERYLTDGPLASYEKNGFGLCLVERSDDYRSLGICGFLKRSYLQHPDLGFAFLPAYVGQGYASEAANTYLVNTKKTLRLKTVLAITTPHNQRSIALLKKLGFLFEGLMKDPSNGDNLSLFRLD
ncbi:MAG TPA: GNAT family N-acetyltransferase [Chryseosolibacter sp.]|nr:GNAT family N-acetyltransferase [Chryseosolibacter sp.]